MLDKKTLTTGTIQANRGVPDIISCQNLQKKQSVFGQKEDVLIVKFCDRRLVHIITTKYTAGYKEQSRHVNGGGREMLQKLLPIHHNSDQMGAVDVVDQLLGPCDATRKSYTWFKKIGVHMMCRMVLSARVIYQNLHKCSNGCTEFITLVVHEMLQEYSLGFASLCVVQEEQQHPEKKPSCPRLRMYPSPELKKLKTHHFPASQTLSILAQKIID